VKTQAKKGSNGPAAPQPPQAAAAESQAQLLQLLRLHCRSVLFLGRRGPRLTRLSPLHSIFFDSCCCPVTQRVNQRRGRCSHRTKTRNRFVSIANPPFCLSGPRLDIIWLPAFFEFLTVTHLTRN